MRIVLDSGIIIEVEPGEEVRYGLQHTDGRLRLPSWRGLRTDKTVETIR